MYHNENTPSLACSRTLREFLGKLRTCIAADETPSTCRQQLESATTEQRKEQVNLGYRIEYSWAHHSELVRVTAAFLCDKLALTKNKTKHKGTRGCGCLVLTSAKRGASRNTVSQTDTGQMASGQPFLIHQHSSEAHVARFWKLQLNLQPLYPGGDVVTLNVEVEQTGWKRQRWSVGWRKRRETTYEAAWWCAVSVFVTASCVCLYLYVYVCVCV